jgi:endonuclease-3
MFIIIVMDKETFVKVLDIIEKEKEKWNPPVVSLVGKRTKDPYKVLISTLISLRTKDEVTEKASSRLFSLADNPYDMLKLTEEEIAKAIYPAGFYRNKAKTIKNISKQIVERYGGKVPDTLEELLSFKGVGRKTANLVLSEGFGKPAICVDIHVHRISNRLGIVKSKNPEETEKQLMEKIPKEHWNRINENLVAFGQTVCKPVSPFCSKCPVSQYCEKHGVKKYR